MTLDGVRVSWAEAAGFRDKVFTPRVYNTLNVPTIQLVFVSFYLGIARGRSTRPPRTRARRRGRRCTAARSAPSTSRT